MCFCHHASERALEMKGIEERDNELGARERVKQIRGAKWVNGARFGNQLSDS